MKKENEEEVVEKDDEEVVEETTNEETTKKVETEEDEETTDWKAKFKTEEGRRKRAETKLSKPKEKKEPPSKSDLDYGKKAFLTANGIKGAKEFEFVEDELTKSGEELETLLENDYFKTRLESFRAVNKTQEAIPKGSKSSGGAIDSVDYWMKKPIADVPKDMRAKVVNARLKKDKDKGHFYNS